jgi:hypothetical protein
MGNNLPTAYAQPSPFTNPSSAAPSGGVPAAGANAKTMAVNMGLDPTPMNPGPGPSMGGPAFADSGPSALPPHVSPMMSAPLPAPTPAPLPHIAVRTAERVGRPIEPWKDSLRFVMFLWGAVLLVGFATPITIDPLSGYWNLIIDGEGTAKLLPLVIAAVGLLSIVVATVPMSPAPRGLVATMLGLSGFLLPFILLLASGLPFMWQLLLGLVSLVTLVPGLLIRQEYRDSILSRLLITLGVICYFVPFLVPDNGSIPLVAQFKLIGDAPGVDKVLVILQVFQHVIVILALLCWLPAPAPAGGKVFAVTLIAYPIILHFAALLLHVDAFPDVIKNTPNAALFGSGANGGGWLFEVPYLAILSYGLATMFGKQLE